jgi:hypothetical protein
MFKKENIKTTLAGFGTIFCSIATLLKGDFQNGIAGIIAGVGLIAAKG